MSRSSCLSSGSIAPGTQVVCDRKTFVNHISLTGDGTNAAAITVYDNASAASGKVISLIRIGAGGNTIHKEYTFPVRMDNGITVVVTGTGAVATVGYDAC